MNTPLRHSRTRPEENGSEVCNASRTVMQEMTSSQLQLSASVADSSERTFEGDGRPSENVRDPSPSDQQILLIASRYFQTTATAAPPAAQRANKNRPKRKRSSVLGKEALSEVHHDMDVTQLPSWVSPAPSGIGTKSRGKLTADQWRTLCTVHLPITLIRLWGSDSGRRQDVLDNFMNLVSAVQIGGMLLTSEANIQLYEDYILRYLRGMKELYLEAAVKPNHHLAVHLADFLRRFGPVHAWRAFAFERFNNMLQNLDTNRHIGEPRQLQNSDEL